LRAAAALEPDRALLHSYLGKGYAEAGEWPQAEKELTYARKLDPNDPAPWLYSALMKQQQNRINEAVADLEAAQERGENLALFHSAQVLNQDRAVSSANLASIYRDAGMTDVALREAVRAVTFDESSYRAHLFLSDSFNELRDPTRFNLRYETVWFGEYLTANLLAPVGGGRLSQHLAQQDYSKLFEADRLGLANWTEVRSDGILLQRGTQYGAVRNTAWSLDAEYQHNDGIRPNNELSRLEWYSTIKQQITPQDAALLIIKYQDFHSGDNFQYYDPTNARPHFRFDETQEPILAAGYHHEWAPGVHTLLLGARLVNEQRVTDRAVPELALIEDAAGQIILNDPTATFDVNYRNSFEIYSGEVNQIFEGERVKLIVGARGQAGRLKALANLENPPAGLAPLFNNPPASLETGEAFQRLAGYSYLTVQPLERLWVMGGAAYDTVTFPRNFRNPPLAPGAESESQFGPKASVVWNPSPAFALRGAYARSLGGMSLDESYRLEPTQLAGFPQTFRTLISESVVSSVSAPAFDTAGLALDLKLARRTFAGLEGDWLESRVRRDIGVFTLHNSVAPFVPSSTRERLDYQERSLAGSLHQLLGDQWGVGTRYQFTRADLRDTLPGVPLAALPSALQRQTSDLHQLSAYGLFNHPSGFFAKAETHWYDQANAGNAPGPGDDFFQHHLFLGYRFLRRRAEITFGILNLTAQDYRLSPLTLYAELPRDRVFLGRLNFVF
jgi:outer membrane receptor protein involved in Fe transport